MTAVLAWLRGHAVLLSVVVAVGGWGLVEHCRAAGLARDLAAARAEVVIRDATLADQAARHEADRALASERAAIAADLAAADADAERELAVADAAATAAAQVALAPIARDEQARQAASKSGTLSDEVNRRITAGLLPGGRP